MGSLHDVRDEGFYVYGYLEDSQLESFMENYWQKLHDVLWYSSQTFQNKECDEMEGNIPIDFCGTIVYIRAHCSPPKI